MKTLTLADTSNLFRTGPDKRGHMEPLALTDIKRPLQETIATHVIPQLLGQQPLSARQNMMSAEHSQRLGQACLSPNAAAAQACARQLMAQGLDMETLYVQTIPQAARLFHDWWALEQIDFVAVTQATFQLEELVYALSVDFIMANRGEHRAGSGFSALLVNTPGSHHSLGLLILSQFFKRYGWQVISSNQFSAADMTTAVRSEWIDLLGLSISDERQMAAMTQLIVKLRRVSSNPHVQIMVGGPLLRCVPDLAEQLGADFSSLHADEAQSVAASKVQWVQAKQGMVGSNSES